MHVFVTGGNGFIGSVVVRKLFEAGHTVRCLLRNSSKTARIDKYTFEKSYGDVRNHDSLINGMKGCDAVIHLAGLSSWNDINSPLMTEVVVEGSKNIFSAAKQSNNLRTVFVSTAAAINGTKYPIVSDEKSNFSLNLKKFGYSNAKLKVESLCRKKHNEGLPIIIVNPAEVYGPNDDSLITAGNLIDFAKSSPVLACEGGTSVVHVDDVADGIVAALTKGVPGERYILGGDNLTVMELAQLTLNILGLKKTIVKLPNWILRSAGATANAFKLPFPINTAVIPYATHYWFMNNAKAKAELGVNFRDARATLEPTLAWLKEKRLI